MIWYKFKKASKFEINILYIAWDGSSFFKFRRTDRLLYYFVEDGHYRHRNNIYFDKMKFFAASEDYEEWITTKIKESLK